MNAATMTEAAQHTATLEDVRMMIGERNYQTAINLLFNAEGLDPTSVTADDPTPASLSDEGRELFEELAAVDIVALTQQGEDSLQDALYWYGEDDIEAAYEALDDSLTALAMVQRWDMTYCEFFEWLDAVCQG